jgi:hypothetical protein
MWKQDKIWDSASNVDRELSFLELYTVLIGLELIISRGVCFLQNLCDCLVVGIDVTFQNTCIFNA